MHGGDLDEIRLPPDLVRMRRTMAEIENRTHETLKVRMESLVVETGLPPPPVEILVSRDVAREVREYSPEDLEMENFRIDSTGWVEKTDSDGIHYLENSEGDVTEILEGPYAGEQHFRNDGAIERELAKAGKRTMTPEELDSFGERHFDWMLKNFPLAGIRDNSSAAYVDQGAYGVYWASSPTGTYGYYVFLSATQMVPADYNYTARAYGLSVRCLKN